MYLSKHPTDPSLKRNDLEHSEGTHNLDNINLSEVYEGNLVCVLTTWNINDLSKVCSHFGNAGL